MEDARQIALRALTGAFIDRDPSVVERYFAPDYIQHNPSIPNGPAAIPGLIASLSRDFSYEPGMVVADGELVMATPCSRALKARHAKDRGASHSRAAHP
jgi:predicted SnoaL-like aldol condensation-catalyzing enzyme